MTVDDENSIYVGGIPYDCSEDELRRAFELYGSIQAVKIINDRGIGGKCYAFVTFKNPRASIDAINDMDGRTIGGRVVKVNNVKTRGAGGRSTYAGEDFRRSRRGMGRGVGRGRDRDDYDHTREHYRDHSLEPDREREGRDIAHGDDRGRDHFDDRNQGVASGAEENDGGYSRDHDSELERDQRFERHREHSRDGRSSRRSDKDSDHHSRERSRSRSYDKRCRELSSESSDYQHQYEEKKVLLIKRREELRKEVCIKSEMNGRLEEKKQLIADLQRRSLKLEDALSSVKKISSLRQTQLNKLQKCFLHVKEYGERLKNSEHELQDLVESVMLDMDVDIDGNLTNGKVG